MSVSNLTSGQRATPKAAAARSVAAQHNTETLPEAKPSSVAAESASIADAATLPATTPGRSSRLGGAISTACVIAALVGLAYWGHRTNWTMPTFSSLMGGEVAAVDDWCEEHNVPELECIECNAGLLPQGVDYGWCRAHGVAQCPLDHPDVAELRTAPEVSAEDFERAALALAVRPRPENNSVCRSHDRRIQFASVEAMDKAGIDIAIARRRPILETITANGEVVYDPEHLAQLSSRAAGTVWRVQKQVGDSVRRGEVLALVDAADVGRAKSEFLQAIAHLRLTRVNAERLRPLAEGAVSQRQVREADAAYQSAQIRLMSAQQTLVNLGLPVHAEDIAELSTEQIAERIRFLGLPEDVVASLDGDSTTSNLLPLHSPLDGVVLAREVVAGESVDTGKAMFGVADVRRMWLMLNVRQEDAKFLSLGQKVLFRPTGMTDEPEFEGSLDWISTAADDQTRTVKVRVTLPNDDRGLRANTYGTGRIVLRREPNAIVVPTEAIHSDGCCRVVFVRDKNFFAEDAYKFFHVRKVRVGVSDEDVTEIIAGLLPSEVIAAKNSMVLAAQLLKSNLGAGCGCAGGH